MKDSYSFLRNYMSAKGISIEKLSRKGGYRLGNELSGNWLSFKNLELLRAHVCNFF